MKYALETSLAKYPKHRFEVEISTNNNEEF